MSIDRNTLTFIALANEYCSTLEQVCTDGADREALVTDLLKLLPRLYICITDYDASAAMLLSETDGRTISSALDENVYMQVQDALAAIMGEDDTYLETSIDEMRYSDTPVAATISEHLADLYQVCYNLVHSIEDAPELLQQQMMAECQETMEHYWGTILCSVMQALHAVAYNDF